MSKLKSICILIIVCAFFSCKKDDTPNTTNSPKPVASFSNSVVGSLPITVNFTNTTVFQPGSVYNWDFGDGTNSTVLNPSHAYAVNGTYVVKLTHSFTGGSNVYNSSIVINSLQIGSVSVIVSGSFGYSILTKAPYTATFTNTSTNTTSYLWAFGDGSSSSNNNSNFNHTYTTGGTYTVKLTATGSGGSDTTSATLNLP